MCGGWVGGGRAANEPPTTLEVKHGCALSLRSLWPSLSPPLLSLTRTQERLSHGGAIVFIGCFEASLPSGEVTDTATMMGQLAKLRPFSASLSQKLSRDDSSRGTTSSAAPPRTVGCCSGVRGWERGTPACGRSYSRCCHRYC